jgi:hypothetical protein
MSTLGAQTAVRRGSGAPSTDVPGALQHLIGPDFPSIETRQLDRGFQIGMFRPTMIRVDHTNCLQVAIKTHSFITSLPNNMDAVPVILLLPLHITIHRKVQGSTIILSPSVRCVVEHGDEIVDRREVIRTISDRLSCTFRPLEKGMSVYHQSCVGSLHSENPPVFK